MKKTSKFLSLLMAVFALGSVFIGCGGGKSGNHDGTKTVISVMNTGGGVGRLWLDNAIERFKELKKDTSYEDGKTGVEFEVEHTMSTGVATMGTAGYNVYFDEGTPTVLSLQQAGNLICIDDIVTDKSETRNGESISIEDKLQESYRESLKGADGKYYALPHFALHPGVQYDVDLFEAADLFIAAPGQSSDKAETHTCEYGTVDFAKTGVGKKSCGNDGIYGTYDDGLPTSLVEFMVLCDRMKETAGIEPFLFRPGYAQYFINALWASLAGAESTNTRYTYTGELEVVTDYSDENLFDGIDYIKKPVTQKKTIDRGTGYLANDNAARYYATAMMEILYKEDWIGADTFKGTLTHIQYMENFVFSGKNGKPKVGMFLEGDYWYNEARDNDVFNIYESVTGDKNRRVAWMPLPTSVNESVTEGNGREYTMINTGCNYAFINANISDKTGLVQACKDFLKFCYSDPELSNFTVTTNVFKAGMDYSVDTTDMPYFSTSVVNCKTNANTKTVNAYKDALYNDQIDYPTLDKKYGSYWRAMKDGGYTAREIFEASRTKAEGWGVTNL